jgi:hypothetical protein
MSEDEIRASLDEQSQPAGFAEPPQLAADELRKIVAGEMEPPAAGFDKLREPPQLSAEAVRALIRGEKVDYEPNAPDHS